MSIPTYYNPAQFYITTGFLTSLCGEVFHKDIVEYTTRNINYKGKFDDLVKMVMEAEKAKPASERVLDKWEFTNDPAQVIFYRPVIKIIMIFKLSKNFTRYSKNDQRPRFRNETMNPLRVRYFLENFFSQKVQKYQKYQPQFYCLNVMFFV